jgi:hypothetical protein
MPFAKVWDTSTKRYFVVEARSSTTVCAGNGAATTAYAKNA